MPNPQEHFKRIQKTLMGQKPRQVKQGHGSFITLNFGQAIETLGRGEWMIWIYCCQWEITDGANNILAHCESAAEETALILNQIQDSTLTKLEYHPHSFEISLGFANRFSIKLTPDDAYYADAEYMMIYTPDNHILSFGPQKQLSYE